MRLHISLDDEIVHALDARVGRRQRSAFIVAAVRRALDDQRRWEDIEEVVGALAGSEHDWDVDPAAWVRAQRTADTSRVG
jgi:metal-responsive CopG/Arc/MetJ family transcriptional regulator